MIYELLENLRKDLSVIEDEIEDLLYYRDIFKYLNHQIIDSDIHKDNPYLNFFANGFFVSSISSIFRLLDSNINSISLLNLLREIVANRELFTRDWYLKAAEEIVLLEGEILHPNDDFSLFSNLEKVLKEDIETLLTMKFQLAPLRNKRIAHRDRKYLGDFNLEFREIDQYIDTLDELGVKYSLLLTQIGFTDHTMHVKILRKYDWKAELNFENKD